MRGSAGLLLWLLPLGSMAQRVAPVNVVIILTDDQGAQAGYLGTPGLQTPAMDSLAKAGVAFTKAYCTFPSCSPSRAGLLTGTFPHTNGVSSNLFEHLGPQPPRDWEKKAAGLHRKFGLREGIATLPEQVKKAGYYNGIVGKFHLAPHAKFPFHFWTKKWDDATADAFFKNAGSRPFFLYYNIRHPHRPFGGRAVLSASLQQQVPSGRVPEYLPNTAPVQNDWQDYLAAIEAADREVSALLQKLRDKNLLQNTLIVFAGDNGAPYFRGKYSPYAFGGHCPLVISGPGVQQNRSTANVVSFADILPTVLELLRLPVPASVQGKSLKKLLAGDTAFAPHQFVVSETAFARPGETGYQARTVVTRQFLYVRTNGKKRMQCSPADLYNKATWNNSTYEATLAAREAFPHSYALLQTLEGTPPDEELFDLQTDYWCTRNLSKEPAYQNELKQMRKRLWQWVSQTGDTAMQRVLGKQALKTPTGVKNKQQSRAKF